MTTSYRVQYWSKDEDQWVDCGFECYRDYDDALYCFRLHSENGPRMSHRMVMVTEETIAMSFRDTEVVR